MLFLQLKQARRSVVGPYVHGDRPGTPTRASAWCEYQQALQTVSDPLLGWTTVGDRQYYVRQFRDMKGAVVVDGIDAAALADYAGVCGLLLAKGHARTSGASMIAGYLGRSDKVDRRAVPVRPRATPTRPSATTPRCSRRSAAASSRAEPGEGSDTARTGDPMIHAARGCPGSRQARHTRSQHIQPRHAGVTSQPDGSAHRAQSIDDGEPWRADVHEYLSRPRTRHDGALVVVGSGARPAWQRNRGAGLGAELGPPVGLAAALDAEMGPGAAAGAAAPGLQRAVASHGHSPSQTGMRGTAAAAFVARIRSVPERRGVVQGRRALRGGSGQR